MTEAAHQIEFNLPVHCEEDRDEAPRKSAEIVRLRRMPPQLVGIEYGRTVRLCFEVAFPRMNQFHRARHVAQFLGVSWDTADRLLQCRTARISAEYLTAALWAVRATGEDPFAIEGVREVHNAIFGGVRNAD